MSPQIKKKKEKKEKKNKERVWGQTMVYSTRRFVVVSMCHFVLVFLVLLVLRLPRLGKRELILVLFVRLFDLCLFGFVGFLFLLGSGKGCGL